MSVQWTGALTVTLAENGITLRWWKGTEERTRNFASWHEAAAYMDPMGELSAIDRELFGCCAPSVPFDARQYMHVGDEGHHPMMAETLRDTRLHGPEPRL